MRTGGFDGPVVVANAIKLADYMFTPARVTVRAGAKVTFTNDGGEMHNASSSEAGGWDTGLIAHGQSVAITFNRPGTYNFNCSPHPSMIGQIVVTGEVIANALPVVVERGPAPPGAPAAAHEH